jgi:negative regulator of replication initiation
MKTINLEDTVFADLDKLTSPLFSHSDVIRKLLLSRGGDVQPTVQVRASENGSLAAYVQSADYRMLNSGISKYLAVLGWLVKSHPKEFQKVLTYKRGTRVYFAGSEKEIMDGGNGALTARKIPNSSVWTLATIDNPTKRKILSAILRVFGYKSDEINSVVSTIADSGRGLDLSAYE